MKITGGGFLQIMVNLLLNQLGMVLDLNLLLFNGIIMYGITIVLLKCPLAFTLRY